MVEDTVDYGAVCNTVALPHLEADVEDEALAAEKAAAATVDADQAQLDADTVQLGYATITAPRRPEIGAVTVA